MTRVTLYHSARGDLTGFSCKGHSGRSLKEGYVDFAVENSSEKGKIEFKLADPDKVDYDAEFKKLKEGDTFKATIVGETTKDVLDKMNNNWGTFTLVL